MSNIVQFDTVTRTAIGELWRDNLDAGAGPGALKIYSAGSTPALPGDALPGDATLLVTFTLGDPSGTVTSGVLTCAAIAAATVAADGTARFGRFEDSTGTVRGQADCGGPGSGAVVIFNDPVLVTSTIVTVTVASVTF